MNSVSIEDKTFKNSVLLVTTFAAFLVPFLSSAINLALPPSAVSFMQVQ